MGMAPQQSLISFTANEIVDAVLVLSDGDFWLGKGQGARGKAKGEVCFNVSMVGYQEIITDPSYAGQIINFTFPHVGNVGCNDWDQESRQAFCKGVILREPITVPSNFRASESFTSWLEGQAIVGICGVDTRAITCNVRRKGARSAMIYFASPGEVVSVVNLCEEVKGESTLLGKDLAAKVSMEEPYSWKEGAYRWSRDRPKSYESSHSGESLKNYKSSSYSGEPLKNYKSSHSGEFNPSGEYHVVVIDYGVKTNILRCLVESGFWVTVVPALTHIEELVLYKPDGVFLSNGPGDPFKTSEYVRQVIEGILERNIPLFGVCLGQQLLALASGLKTVKLHRGHRGGNHPVRNLLTNKVEITSQNHGFCVSRKDVPENVEITHESIFDGSVEGIRRKDKYAFAVQYHPESSPGPHDSYYLFQDFYKMIEKSKGIQGG